MSISFQECKSNMEKKGVSLGADVFLIIHMALQLLNFDCGHCKQQRRALFPHFQPVFEATPQWFILSFFQEFSNQQLNLFIIEALMTANQICTEASSLRCVISVQKLASELQAVCSQLRVEIWEVRFEDSAKPFKSFWKQHPQRLRFPQFPSNQQVPGYMATYVVSHPIWGTFMVFLGCSSCNRINAGRQMLIYETGTGKS